MSEEEIISIIESLWFDVNEYGLRNVKMLYPELETPKLAEEAVQGLLELYNKEKEKNKLAYHTGFKDGGISKKYEWQDKIKEKIKELEKEQEEYKDSKEWEIQDDITAQIIVLKELLEG